MSRVDEVLASLREERERLRAELERVDQAIASLDGSAERAAGREMPPYVFLNVYEATAAYLAASGEPKTTREIADALKAGGFKTRALNFTHTLGTMLRRETSSAYGIRRSRNGKRWSVNTRRDADPDSQATSDS